MSVHHDDQMADEIAVDPAMGGKLRTRHRDRVIAELADRQHGVVARAQLLEMGLGRRVIDHRLKRGALHPVHRGVYAVGHRVLSMEARWMAAVLVGGEGAVLSHRSAAELWGMRTSTRSRIEATVPRRCHPRPGVQLHFVLVPFDEVTTVRGIPVTTVPRTVLDLAAVVGRRHVERALHEAEVRRLGDRLSLDDLVARHPGRRAWL